MDLIKIGKYIAGKRKDLGLTQAQLAEKLGMSDKSVSKWERGVCLPDVSVYMELCGILGISLNEFIAGEDLSGEAVIPRSEENLIQVTEDEKKRRGRLKKWIAILAAASLVILAILIVVLARNSREPSDFIRPFPRDSTEMRTARLLSGPDGAYLYEYDAGESRHTLTVRLTVYRSGELVSQSDLVETDLLVSGRQGVLALVPDYEGFQLRLILENGGVKYDTGIDILEGVENRRYYGRAAAGLSDTAAIRPGEEIGLLALYYDANGIAAVLPQDILDRELTPSAEFTYLFSAVFD